MRSPPAGSPARYGRLPASSQTSAAPSFIVSHELGLDEASTAYEHFGARDEGWTKVVLHPNDHGNGHK